MVRAIQAMAGDSQADTIPTESYDQKQPWDAVETYFECITTCSLDDGDCITRCVEQLREADC